MSVRVPISIATAALLLATVMGVTEPAGAASEGSRGPLTGYQVVTGSTVSVGTFESSFQRVACPTGDEAIGGGVEITGIGEGSGVPLSINSSYPLAGSWEVDVFATSDSGSYVPYAICVAKSKKYQFVTSAGSATGSTQSGASATCPSGTVPISGGVASEFDDVALSVNTSYPISDTWRVDVNNSSAGSLGFTVYEVCHALIKGYKVVASAPATSPPGLLSGTNVSCPAFDSVLGGGAYSSSGSILVSLSEDVPSGSSAWGAQQYNGSTFDSTLTTYAVCAKGA